MPKPKVAKQRDEDKQSRQGERKDPGMLTGIREEEFDEMGHTLINNRQQSDSEDQLHELDKKHDYYRNELEEIKAMLD